MIVLQFHLEVSEGGEAFWSIDSPDLPSLYASSPRLVDCRRLAHDVLDAAGLRSANVSYVLAG